MNFPKILYEIKKAAVPDLLSNLKACDMDFVPPLSQRVNLDEYSNKLYTNSITFEAWSNNKLIGMVAAYFNNLGDSSAYVSNVCVENVYKGNNIATVLMKNCINYGIEKNFKTISLNVDENNLAAINLYKKCNFIIIGKNKTDVTMTLVLRDFDNK
jgi:ribosomal protein S18 acetylase RimI-like enzyme